MGNTFRYRWTGAAWEPMARLLRRCQQTFQPGQIADLEPTAERSPESHGHYFACLHQAFVNLPEAYADRFASEEHLRKWCLIKSGYRSERTFVAASPEAAHSMAAFIAPLDEYAVIVVHGNLISVLTAKTQKLRRNGDDGMDKKEFEASKDDVLRVCSEMIGVDVTTLLAQESPPLAPAHHREREKEPVE
jgi:hypothetical protein